ncbi:MAG: DEAD/DEAH box helicase [Aquificaceae bacterium]
MGKALRIHVLKESYYRLDPPEGRVIYSNGKETREEELIRAADIDKNIGYPLLNPIQTVFYRFYKGGNALIASPTSSGKSLIAYLFMRNFEGRVVYAVPTRSLAKEKLLEFKRFYPRKVELRTGENVLESYKEVKAKVIVSTYEHFAFSLRNRARWLENLSAVVIDEVHQILKRWILEEIITSCVRSGVPMLCLSATLPGVEELAGWIGADLVIESAWRPVPLYRSVENLTHYKPIRQGLEGEGLIAGRLLNALFSIKNRDDSVILFVPKKSLGWKLLELAGKERIGIMNQTLPFEVEEEREPEVAFHNADVPKEEREAIEKAFREGKLKTLIATQTLAYGVNLPADRVIVFTRFFRSKGELKSIPDTLDIIQMEGRAGRFGIRDVGYSNLLVYGAKEGDLKKGLDQALNKPFSTATMEEGESLDIISFFLLLAHLYEKGNPERYLESTYSFRHVSRIKIRKVESFLRDYGYLEGNSLSQKGLFCVRSGIPPTSFESFIRRKSLQLDTMACIRPLLYMKKFDSLFFFLKERERFEEDLRYIKGMLLPCGSDCWKDNTEQFLFYVEGLTVRYANLKNPPGEFSYLSTDAVHLLRVLMDINKQGFYRFSSQEILRIAHAVKYGIRPEYSGLAGIKGIGHIRANLLKEVLMESKVNPPRLGEPTAYLLELMELERLYDLLLEKVVEYRGLSTEKAREEVDKIKKVLLNNKNGYMVDDKILLAFGLFLEGPSAMRRTKKELVELIKWS